MLLLLLGDLSVPYWSYTTVFSIFTVEYRLPAKEVVVRALFNL